MFAATHILILILVGIPKCKFEVIRSEDAEKVSEFRESTLMPANNNDEQSTPVKLNIKQNLLMNQIVNSFAIHIDVSDPLCKHHSEKFKEDLRAFKPWALKMFDSSSKLQSGVLAGNLIDFGCFDQCLAIIEEDPEYGVISGKHCVVEIVPDDNIMEIILSYRNFTMKQLDELSGGEGVPLKWSVCVPDSCPAADIENHFRKIVAGIAEGANINLTVRNESCISRSNRKKFNQEDWSAIILFGIIIILMIISTVYDLNCNLKNKGPSNKLLVAFSIYSNIKKLSHPPSNNYMSAIFGLRFITMCWIICGHRFLMTMFFPVDNTLDILNWMIRMSSMVVIGGSFAVDTFFIISGLLVSYRFLHHMNNGGNFNLLLFWFHRYLRLTPAFGATVLVYATILYHIGIGPLWVDLMESVQKPCRTYWWSAFLYIQNFINPGELCIVQTWYLMCDMQMFFISPIILYPLWKWPKYGLFQISILILLSMAISFELAWTYEYRGGMPVTNALLHTDYFKYHYIVTYTRASPWLIGIILGYIIYNTKDVKINIKKSTAAIAWIISLVIMLSVVFGAYPFVQPDHVYDKLEASIYLSTSRIVWGLAISWIIFACVHGYGGLINDFLSIKLFQIWGRISYTMFLVHMMVQYIIGGNERIQTHFSNVLTLYMFFGDFVYTSIVALIFTLMFEAPFIVIESTLLRNEKRKDIKISPSTKPDK